MTNPLIEQSDKHFWHRFVPVYEAELKTFRARTILEFGVFKGNSIRWLAEKYPNARIFGCDILPLQPEWPRSERIKYFQVDQSSPEQIRKLFTYIDDEIDLLIEDGSHVPVHQKNCLVEGLQHIRHNGLYILEDIHTSHPDHAAYRAMAPGSIAPLQLLLAIEHLQASNQELTDSILRKLSANSVFTSEEIQLVYRKVVEVRMFKRATLPIKCYACGNVDFDYATLQCPCGTKLYESADSMTAILRIV